MVSSAGHPEGRDVRMRRSTGETDADGGDAGKIRARAADAAPAGPAQRSTGSAANRGAAAKTGARTAKTGARTAKTGTRDAETAAPGPRDGRKFARVFMSGRSQAVRLPKEFRFDVDRVIIRREGRHVVLSPPFKDWEDYWENGARFTDDFYEAMEELDKEELPLEEREPFD